MSHITHRKRMDERNYDKYRDYKMRGVSSYRKMGGTRKRRGGKSGMKRGRMSRRI